MVNILKEIKEEDYKKAEALGISREKLQESAKDAQKVVEIFKEVYQGEVDKERLEALVDYAIKMSVGASGIKLEDCESDMKFGIGVLVGMECMLSAFNFPAIVTGDNLGLIASACARYMGMAQEVASKRSDSVALNDFIVAAKRPEKHGTTH